MKDSEAYGDIPHMSFDPQPPSFEVPQVSCELPQVSWGLRKATMIMAPVGALAWFGIIKTLIWIFH